MDAMPGYQLNMDSVIRKALGLVLVFIAGMAHGQTSSAESDMLETTRHWLDQAVSSVRSSGSSALKMEVILARSTAGSGLPHAIALNLSCHLEVACGGEPAWGCDVQMAQPDGVFSCQSPSKLTVWRGS